jgi:hypothetical protein
MKLIVSVIPLLISGVYCQRNWQRGKSAKNAGSQHSNTLTTNLSSTTANAPTCIIYTGKCVNPDVVTHCKKKKIRGDCITEEELNKIRKSNYDLTIQNYDHQVMKIKNATKRRISNDAERLINSIKTPKLVEGDFSAALSQIELPCHDFVSAGYLLPKAAESKVHNYENEFTKLNQVFFQDTDTLVKKYINLAQFKLGGDLQERLSEDFKTMKGKLIELLQKNGNDALSQVTLYTGNLQECFDNECNYSFGLITLEVLNGAINLRMKGGSFIGAPKFEAKVDQLNMLSMLIFRVQEEFIGEGLIGNFKEDSNCAQYISKLPEFPHVAHDEDDHKVVDCNDDEADGVAECMKWKIESLKNNILKQQTENKSLKQDIEEKNKEIENGKTQIGKNNNKIESLEQDIRQKKSDIENQAKTIVENNNKIDSLTQDNEKQIDKIETFEKKIGEKKKEIEDQKTEIKDLMTSCSNNNTEQPADYDSVADNFEVVDPEAVRSVAVETTPKSQRTKHNLTN